MKETSIDKYKMLLDGEVTLVESYINKRIATSDSLMYSRIDGRAQMTFKIVKQIYELHKNNKNLNARSNLVEIIDSLKYNDRYGYIFINDIYGNEIYNPVVNESELKNLQNYKRISSWIINNLKNKLVKTGDNIALEYEWTKSTKDDFNHLKRSRIYYLKELGWYVAYGEYYDENIDELKNELLAFLEKVELAGNRYIFSGNYKGIGLSGPNRGVNNIGLTDINGVKVVEELISKAKEGGGFVQYVMPFIEGQPPFPKLSYVRPIDRFQWYIGSGIYMKSIFEDLEDKRDDFADKIRNQILFSSLSITAILIILFFVMKAQGNRIKTILIELENDLKNTVNNSFKRDSCYKFKEFNHILSTVNGVVIEKNEAARSGESLKLFFSKVIDSTPSTLIVIDEDGNIRYHNNSGFGIKLSESKNLWNTETFISESNEEISNFIGSSLNQMTLDYHWDNKHYNLFVYKILVNEELLYVLRLDDVTEIVQKDERLHHSQKMEMIGTMAGGIAHDFNNILASISGNTQLLLRKINKNEIDISNFEEKIKVIDESALKASDVVKRLLTLTRISEINLEPIDLNTCVDNTIKIVESMSDKRVNIVFNDKVDKIFIAGDKSQIETSLLNIFINGIHSMTDMRKNDKDRGGTLTIKTGISQQGLNPICFVSIQDVGVGMSEEIKSRIFEPFFTTKGSGRGTGLGLSSVLNIINQHKGYIDVISEPDKGTKFIIYFPMIDKAPQIIAEESKDSKDLYGKVLIVDDEKNLRDLCKEILAERGFSVFQAEDGNKALEIYKKYNGDFNLVLTDLSMPNRSGADLFWDIMKIKKNQKIIIITGNIYDSRLRAIRETGFNNFLNKPFTITSLNEIIDVVYDLK
ncbi:MAG: cache domain-containing protein [Candidatus Delongbacteria bacterium]|nr:cache domain-containing protein [Candidatus Delongbacteria bacterium]